MIYLRLCNIVANWTKATESPLYEETMNVVDGVEMVTKQLQVGKTKKQYNKYHVGTTFPDGTNGTKIIHMTGDDAQLPSAREHINDEQDLSQTYGKSVRITYLNAEWLRNLEVIWDVDVVVSPENDSQMKLIVYLDNLTRVTEIFGAPGASVFKKDYVLQRIAEKMSEDPDKMFNPADQTPPGTPPPGGAPPAGAPPAISAPNAQRPSPVAAAM